MQMERARRRRGDMNPSSSSPQHSSPHPTSSNADSSVNDPVDTDQHLFEQTHTFSNHSAPSDSPETTTTSDPQVAGQLNGHVTPTRQRRSINKTFSSSPQSQSSGSHLDTSSPDSKMAPSTGPSSPARTRGAGKRAKSQIPTEAPPILPPQSFLAAAAATRKSKRKLNETPSNDTTPSSSSQDTPVDGTISRGSKRQKVASTINDEPATETTKAKASTRKRAGRSRATQAKSDSTVDTSVNTNGRKGSSSSAPDEVKSSSVGPSRVSTRNKDKPSKAVPTTEPIANGRTSKASKVRKSTRRTAADAAEEARVEDDNVVGVAPNNADDNDSLDDEEAISQQVQTDLIEASSVESNVPLADDNADAEGESVDENDEVVDHNTDGVAHKTNDTAVENSSTEVFNKDAEVEEEDYDDDADADGDVDSQIAAEEALVNGIETEAGDEPATAQATDDEEDAVADDVNDDNDGVAAIVDGEGEQAVSANGKEDVEADEAEAEVNGGLEGEDVNVEPEVTERPKRGRPGRPGKGMRGAKTNNLPRPALPPRAGSKIAVKGKQAKGNRPGWQGKRKLADNWKLQAYYDRQATLKQQYKGLAKIILQSKQILLDKAIEKIKETEPLHYKDEPEYEQLNSELTTRFDERKGKLDARHALDKTQIQTLYERNVDVEQRIYQVSLILQSSSLSYHILHLLTITQRAIEDAREDALFNAKQAILGLVKGHFQRSDNPDAPIVNDVGISMIYLIYILTKHRMSSTTLRSLNHPNHLSGTLSQSDLISMLLKRFSTNCFQTQFIKDLYHPNLSPLLCHQERVCKAPPEGSPLPWQFLRSSTTMMTITTQPPHQAGRSLPSWVTVLPLLHPPTMVLSIPQLLARPSDLLLALLPLLALMMEILQRIVSLVLHNQALLRLVSRSPRPKRLLYLVLPSFGFLITKDEVRPFPTIALWAFHGFNSMTMK